MSPKRLAPLLQLPLSVSTVTRQEMADRDVQSVRELVQPERGSSTPVDATAQGRDAPENSGNFAGGHVSSTTQSNEYGINMSTGTARVMDADGNYL